MSLKQIVDRLDEIDKAIEGMKEFYKEREQLLGALVVMEECCSYTFYFGGVL